MSSLFRKALSALHGRAPSCGGNIAAAPDGWCVYAIGDIHGERRCLEMLLAVIATHHQQRANDTGERAVLVFLGDYIDRGQDSRGVLDILSALADSRAEGCGVVCRFLCGNHETAMLNFLADPVAGAEWLSYGGAETLASYGIGASSGVFDARRCQALRDRLEDGLPDRHRAFLDALEPMVTLGDYVFVHAGVKPGVPLHRQRLADMQWIREPFLSSQRFHGKVVVHGHTPVSEPEILPNRIAVDTGAYATGTLAAVRLYKTARSVLKVTL